MTLKQHNLKNERRRHIKKYGIKHSCKGCFREKERI